MTITAEERERRKSLLGSSDVAQIMTGNGVKVALQKMGEIPEPDIDHLSSVQLGDLLEPRVIDAYEAQEGVQVIRSPSTMVHPSFPWLGAHLDAWEHPGTVIEAKNLSSFNRKEWGDPGTDQVPMLRYWQVMAQMAVSGAPKAKIPVCFINEAALTALLLGKGLPITTFVVEARDDMIEYLIDESRKVWRCIESRTLPEPITLRDTDLIYRQSPGVTEVKSTDEILSSYEELMNVRSAIKELEELKGARELEIKQYMRAAAILVSHKDPGRVLATWKQSKPTKVFDRDALSVDHPELVKAYTITREGNRPFLPKEKK